MYDALFSEVFEILKEYGERRKKESDLNLRVLLLIGRVLCYEEKYKEALKVADQALILSEKIQNVVGSIDSLIIKSHCVFLGNLGESNEIISNAEKLINSISNNPTSDIPRLYSDFLIMKFIVLRYTGDLKKSFEIANYWRTLFESSSEKIDQARVYMQLSESYLYDGKVDDALHYAEASLMIHKEFNNKIGIASSLYFVGQSYFVKGEIEKSIEYFKNAMAIHEKSILITLETTHMLGAAFREKGEIGRALRYCNRAAQLAKKENYVEKLADLLVSIGTLHRMKGESKIALDYFTQSLEVCRKIKSLYGIAICLFYMILISLEKNLLEEAESYLPELAKITDQTKSAQWRSLYMLAKALILKKPKRLKSRSSAEMILKEIVEDHVNLTPQLRLFTIINLCDLLLEELVITNNDEILVELTPLINLLLDISQKTDSYLWLAEAKLLQAKLALIKMNILDARMYMLQAQMIAEMHGLNLLAIKISNDHDSLLDQSSLWNELFENKAPYSERIKLASIDTLLSQMEGRKLIEESQIIDEEPILLLIMSEDGVPQFTHSFRKDWDFEFLFSSFLSAFNSFSSEIFSKTIDRIKIGENKILINPMKSFLVCYVIRGQSYPAQRKLLRFSKEIEQNSDILIALKRSVETCRSLQLDDPPILGTVVSKIFPQVKI